MKPHQLLRTYYRTRRKYQYVEFTHLHCCGLANFGSCSQTLNMQIQKFDLKPCEKNGIYLEKNIFC